MFNSFQRVLDILPNYGGNVGASEMLTDVAFSTQVTYKARTDFKWYIKSGRGKQLELWVGCSKATKMRGGGVG